MNEITNAYRNSRRNTSILCGIGIAWSAAQFEIKNLSVNMLGDVNLEGATIQIILSVLCVYSLTRCTIEYMMQEKNIRRNDLAKLDYLITLYMARLALVMLAASAISRSSKMVLYVFGFAVVLFLGFFLLSLASIFFIMPIRCFIGRLQGRTSVASAAIESSYWSFIIVGLAYICFIVLIGFSVINPFVYIGPEFANISGLPLAIFATASLVVLFSCFLDVRFLHMVFAYIPPVIEISYFDDQGRECFVSGPNPEHPDYKDRDPKGEMERIQAEQKEKKRSSHIVKAVKVNDTEK